MVPSNWVHWVKENEGMMVYGGFKPKFSVRAWRSGAEMVTATNIEVAHRFKSPERVKFTSQARTLSYTSPTSTSSSPHRSVDSPHLQVVLRLTITRGGACCLRLGFLRTPSTPSGK